MQVTVVVCDPASVVRLYTFSVNLPVALTKFIKSLYKAIFSFILRSSNPKSNLFVKFILLGNGMSYGLSSSTVPLSSSVRGAA